MSVPELAQSLADLDAWLQTMRQRGGYGGPVAHYWQSRYRYAGPGLDWRYEGLLIGYMALWRKTRDARWCARLRRAAEDLMLAQGGGGAYAASRFEMNPGTLGTPHEAAATLGLLSASAHLGNRARALEVAKRNLDGLVAALWDGRGFNDRPSVKGRVPNKLATLAQALLTYDLTVGEMRYESYVRAALEDVLRYQVQEGQFAGAIHQYAPGGRAGDGRFFPLYNARCIPPLVLAADALGEARFRVAAERVLAFLGRTYEAGVWPQLVYANGRRARWPRWLAGSADILLAYRALGAPLPAGALERLLASQMKSGGFRTAEGFAGQITQRPPARLPDYRDVTPVVGWNDKVLRLFGDLLEQGAVLPDAHVSVAEHPVSVWGTCAHFHDGPDMMSIRTERGIPLYLWSKDQPWAHPVSAEMDVR